MPKLFLDCDGVLADFDSGASAVLGRTPHEFEAQHGRREFWRRIAGHSGFFATLPLMPDAMVLWEAVAHLHPVILTGVPAGDWAAPQKMRWAAEHVPGARMITTLARLKREHMEVPGDVLVDDTLTFRSLWEEAGGVFVRHESATKTIDALAKLGFDVRTQR